MQTTQAVSSTRRRRASVFRRLLSGIGFIILLSVLAAIGLMVFLREDRVTALAKDQMARLAGPGYVTDLTTASLSFFAGEIARIDIAGVSIRNAKTDRPLLQGGNASFSVSLLPLLSGKIQLTDLTINGADMYLSANANEKNAFLDGIFDADGLVDPALISELLDTAATTISLRLAANPELIIKASNTKLILGHQAGAPTILLENLLASKSIAGEFVFEAAIAATNWRTNMTGAIGQIAGGQIANDQNASGQTASGQTSISYRLALDPVPFTRSFTAQLPDLKPRSCSGLVGLAIASSQGLASVDVNLVNAKCTLGGLGDYAIATTINGKLKPKSGIFEIGRGVVIVNRNVFNFDGAIAPARYTPLPEKTGETARYRYELVFSPSQIDPLENTEGALGLTGKIAGTYAPTEQRLALDEFTADADGSIIRGAASLLFTDVTPALYLALVSDKLPVKDFKRIWPRFAAPNSRRIVMERINSGLIRNMRLELQLPPGKIGSKTLLQRDQLAGSGDLEAASFSTFGDLPPVENAKGSVRFDGESVDIALEAGTTQLASGKTATIKPSSFTIADTHKLPVIAELKVALEGSAQTIAELAAQKPINAFNGQNFTPQDVSGQAQVSGTLQLTLVPRGQKAPPPTYQINVDLTDVAIAKPINGQTISSASGTIKATNIQTDIRLDAQLSGVPAKIIISEPRGVPEQRTQDVVLTITDALRDKIAPNLKGFLSGPIFAQIKGSSSSANVELDLTKASLRIVPLNWEKGVGVGAKATFKYTQDNGAISISNLELSGRGIQGTGKVQLKNGALQSAELRNVRLNSGDNFSLSLKQNAGALNVVLGGKQLDARAIMKSVLPGRKPSKNSNASNISVGGEIGRLIGFNDEAVLNAAIGYTPGKNAALSLSGVFASGGSIDVSQTSGSNGKLIVQTSNAGAALRFVDLYKRMIGGTLATNFKVGRQSDLAGGVSISDFVVIGEPRLAKLASEQANGSASLAEATNADLVGEKARFELVQGDVALESGTIRLSRGIVRGANVGATAEGVVLSATGQMDLRGTFMPARGLNRIVGAIPILGLFLGSGSKAGLIGITYRLAGEAKNPKVFVNPISVIAPGIFRQIFE